MERKVARCRPAQALSTQGGFGVLSILAAERVLGGSAIARIRTFPVRGGGRGRMASTSSIRVRRLAGTHWANDPCGSWITLVTAAQYVRKRARGARAWIHWTDKSGERRRWVLAGLGVFGPLR